MGTISPQRTRALILITNPHRHRWPWGGFVWGTIGELWQVQSDGQTQAGMVAVGAGSAGLAMGGNGAASKSNLPVEVSAVAGQNKNPGAGPGA